MKNRIGTIITMVTATAFIAIGIAGGQPAAVMTKAINICLECIGIG